MDEYFITVEDVEWSLRARLAGWRIIYAPAASLLHKDSASTRDQASSRGYSPTRIYYENRNAIWLIRRFGNRLQKWLVWPVIFTARWSYKLAGYTLLRRWEKLRALLSGIKDGILSRYPK